MKHLGYRFFLVLLLIYLSNNIATAQSNTSFLECDSIAFQNTITRVYQIWGSSEYSKEQEIDTILCAFILQFDTLNLRRIKLGEELLKKSISFSLDENNSYKCDCEVYNTDLESIATFGTFNDYHVFHKANYNLWGPEYLKKRILDNGDMVFIPQSKVHTFNFKWRLLLTKNNELKWMNTDNPSQLFYFSELQQSNLEPLILGN